MVTKGEERGIYNMAEIYLTENEIYELDKVNDLTLAEYLKSLPSEKRELASYVFSKNRAARMLKVRVDEANEGIDRLIEILEKNGISHVG